jgi:hypothetical protein
VAFSIEPAPIRPERIPSQYLLWSTPIAIFDVLVAGLGCGCIGYRIQRFPSIRKEFCILRVEVSTNARLNVQH